MAQRTLEEIAADDRRIIYRLDNISHVAHNINTEDFETLMPERIGRPRWEWFEEMFSELPPAGNRDACTTTFTWFKRTFGLLPDRASEDLVVRSLCRATNRNVAQLASPLNLLQSWIFGRFSTLRPYGVDNFVWPLASRWGRYLPTSDEKEPRVNHDYNMHA
ncbi:hypothetical protein PIB30_099156, partial [Stylosanthes scabra]|nr:hypothetical protein [Stylosanthes scabra]